MSTGGYESEGALELRTRRVVSQERAVELPGGEYKSSSLHFVGGCEPEMVTEVNWGWL